MNKEFIHTDKANLADTYYILVLLKLAGAFIPLLFIRELLPSNGEIQDVETKHLKISKKESDTNDDEENEIIQELGTKGE